MEEYTFSNIQDILQDVKDGKPIILLDSPDRENEGDLVVATEKITAKTVSFMLNSGRGLVCVSIDRETAKKLNLPFQISQNLSAFTTPFSVTVDHISIAHTGCSAKSRAITMKKLIDKEAKAEDFIVPGNVCPLIAHPAGVFGRAGQTEGSYDLARLAGLTPSGVICEILDKKGMPLKGKELFDFANKHNLKITSISAIKEFRKKEDIFVRCVFKEVVNTSYGLATLFVFEDDLFKLQHFAIAYNNALKSRNTPVKVRVHSECITGDVLFSRRCDCGRQLQASIKSFQDENGGILIYLRQEGRGIGLSNKIKAYSLQDSGKDTVDANLELGFPADLRNFALAAKILSLLKINDIILLTNNPEKVTQLQEFGINIIKRMPILTAMNDAITEPYLRCKRDKLGHIIPLDN